MRQLECALSIRFWSNSKVIKKLGSSSNIWNCERYRSNMWKKQQQVFLIILEKRESNFLPIKWKWALIEVFFTCQWIKMFLLMTS